MLFASLFAFLQLACSFSFAQITYFSDVPLYSSLVECASIGCSVGLSNIYNCGSTSPAQVYASCACIKDQNSASITSELSDIVYGACGMSATDDVTSVLAVFSSWCQAVAPKDLYTTKTSATSGKFYQNLFHWSWDIDRAKVRSRHQHLVPPQQD